MTRAPLILVALIVFAAACVPPDEDDDDTPETVPAAITLGELVECVNPTAPGEVVPFTDVSAASTVEHSSATPQWTEDPVLHPSAEVESHGGFSVSDLDGDGELDLLFSDAVEGPRLLLGDGAFGFIDVDAPTRGLPSAADFAHGVSTVDIDGDGDLDVFLLYKGFNRFFTNDGTANFTEVTDSIGLGGREDDRSLTASWADFDRDGDLDLYVANHGEGSYGPGQGYEPDQDHLYVQESGGRFRDRIDWILTPEQAGYAFLGGWFDADDDGWLDLYIVNDLAVDEMDVIGNLFVHNGGGFDDTGAWSLEIAPEAQLEYRMAGMGLAIGDMDGDGDMDLHISNAGPTTLARNDGGVFTDVSLAVAGFSNGKTGDISWATAWFDHDNDGSLELFTAYGHMPTKDGERAPNNAANPRLQLDSVWAMDDDGAFYDIATELGLANPERTRTAVVADIDRNGFPDLVTWALFDGPRVYQAGCNANAWLRVELELPGTRNVDAIGARVQAWVDGAIVASGDIALGSDEVMSAGPAEVLLGLGGAEEVEIIVRWPDGVTTVNPAVPTRRGVILSR
jgi:hypothetical protein